MLEVDNLVETLSEQVTVDLDGKPESLFADMLNEYQPAPMRQGQYVVGEILRIGENVILVDVAAKRTAVVPAQDLARIGDEDLAQLSVGDTITLYVLRTPEGDEDLLVSLSKGLAQKDWDNAKVLLDNEESIFLEVVGYNKGGLEVGFGKLRGFVPTSHVPQLRNFYNQQTLETAKGNLMGEELPLKVIEVDRDRRRLVLSGKGAQKEIRQKRLLELQQMQGQTIMGVVTNLLKFGAFVDLDGVDGLIHISEITWNKVDHPSDYLTPGEEVEVVIQSVDIERERVSLNRRALLPSPWESFAESHAVGDLVEGDVVGVADFGAFVRLNFEIEGLIHISEMRGTQDSAAKDVLLPGDKVLVRILSIQPERGRLGLSQTRISQNEEMDWTWQRQQNLLMSEDEEE